MPGILWADRGFREDRTSAAPPDPPDAMFVASLILFALVLLLLAVAAVRGLNRIDEILFIDPGDSTASSVPE